MLPVIVKTAHSGADVFVVLDSLNSVLYPDSVDSKTNSYIFNLPKDIRISVVSYKAEHNTHLFDLQKTNSSEKVILMGEKQTPVNPQAPATNLFSAHCSSQKHGMRVIIGAFLVNPKK